MRYLFFKSKKTDIGIAFRKRSLLYFVPNNSPIAAIQKPRAGISHFIPPVRMAAIPPDPVVHFNNVLSISLHSASAL